MQKDKLYGLAIFIFALVLLVYLVLADINVLGAVYDAGAQKFYYPTIPILPMFQPWVYVVGPLMLAEILIFGIAAWIGWTMMTTPPPVPLEELEEAIN